MKFNLRDRKLRKFISNYLINNALFPKEIKLKHAFLLKKKYIDNNDLLRLYFALKAFMPERYLNHEIEVAIFNYYIIKIGQFKKFNEILFKKLGKNIFTLKDELYFKFTYYRDIIISNNRKSIFHEIRHQLMASGYNCDEFNLAVEEFLDEN